MNRFTIALAFVALYVLLPVPPVLAETRFVNGVNDGIRIFATINRNGTEYRTDELGAVMNKHIWDELSTEDRRSLINVYGWGLSRRADHFGSTSTDMSTWINQEQGWTAAAEALKTRHANKAFPTLTPVFGPDASLTIPDFYCANPEIANSDNYKEASRLAMEIQADYAVGKQIYTMLTNAKWDQLSIAVKTLSEPLIKMIVDNFITGFVTNGASKVSELVATAYSFRNDLIDFIKSGQRSGNKPPTPIELIERLEKYITEMEGVANTAVSLIEQKKIRLQNLADQLKQLDKDTTDRKKREAATLKDTLTQKTTSAATPYSQDPFVPQVPDEASQADKDDNIRLQAQWFYNSLQGERYRIEGLKSASYYELTDRYLATFNNPSPYYEASRYFPDTSDQFARPYFEITDKLDTVAQWLAIDIPNVINTMVASKSKLAGATTDVEQSIDARMPDIRILHGKVLWLEGYAAYLGYSPLEALNMPDLRNFDGVIGLTATADKTAEHVVAEITEQQAVAEDIKTGLAPGINKRLGWMNSEWERYDSLRFNFENSLSYAIAAVKQLDALHSGPYFKRDQYPQVCYSGSCIYKYSVDVAAINAGIAGQPDPAAREAARAAATQELIRLKAQEEALLHRLEIAQNSHLVDAQAVSDFFSALSARTTGFGSIAAILEEFRQESGKTLKDPYMMWDDLVPDITYYYLGSSTSNWIRNRSNMATNLGQAMNLVSGKIPEFYLLFDLYNAMEASKSYYLGLSEAEFNAFMTETTTKIGTYGTYITAFQNNNVWGVDYPAWQLVMKARDRQNRLSFEYYNGYTYAPTTWAVVGTVRTPQGTPVPGITVLLNGYLTASTTTGSDGSYYFDFIGNGEFTVTVSGSGYQFDAVSKPVTVNGAAASADFTATPTAQSGYAITGRINAGAGTSVAGIPVVATSAAGVETQIFTAVDGTFLFSGLPGGTYTLRPVSTTQEFIPASRTINLTASASGQDFSAATAGAGKTYTLNLAVTGDGSGTISQTPTGISCSGSCSQAFAEGMVVSLAATPSPGSLFAGWYGRCSGTATCSVTMAGVRDVLASFVPDVPPDLTPPAIMTFSGPPTSASATVAITLAATDNVAVFRYCLTQTDSVSSCSTWHRTPPTEYNFYLPGMKKLYAFVRDAAGNIAGSGPLDIAITTRLTLEFAGNGHGTVMGDLVCGTPSCEPKDFATESVTLIAAPDADSTFSWSGCDYTYWNDYYCGIYLTTPRTVTLTFTPIPPVRISGDGGSTYFTLMGELGAYNSAADNDIFQIRAVLEPLVETLVFDRDIRITLDGGKSSNYVDTSGDTVFRGSMSIRKGKVTVSRIKIQN